MLLACVALAPALVPTSTTLTMSSGANPVSSGGVLNVGSELTLVAAVTSGAANLTTGQVNFCDAAATYCTDIHLLGTAQLTSAGTAVLRFHPGIGSHSYKAVFLGTKAYASSESGASALEANGTIPPLATTTAINQTGNWGAYTLSAVVTETGNTALPTGSVSFLDTNDGNAVLGMGPLGPATRGVAWSNVDTSAPNLAGVSTAVADLNGDGIPDLFVKDYFGTYNVLLGKGDGTFTIGASAFGPYSQTGSFILGDFNNDGIQDVAAINAVYYAQNNTITIFLGNGDGTFTVSGTSPAIGMSPSGITSADVNGDGNSDLVVSQMDSSGSGQIVVFFGNGDGTFTQASSSTSVGSTAATILPADINRDGNMDLVLSGNGVTILLGKGDGTFTVVAGPTQAGEAAVSVADVNNDGFPDLVFAATTSYLSVFLGKGDGTFTAAPAGPNANLQVGGLAIGDFNHDGIPDIVYAIPGTTAVGLLFGKGDGTFVQASATAAYGYDFNGNFVVADFNGDGWPDVLTVDLSGRTLEDSLTQPTETATASVNVSIAAAGNHLAEASYSGDSNYNPSVSGTIPLWGVPPATATSLTVTSGGTTVSSVGPGSLVTLTAIVTAGGSPVTAGQVNFCDASASFCSDIHVLGSAALSSNGTAAFKFVPGPGTHSYKAVFVENGYGLSSTSAAASLNVGAASPVAYSETTAISASGSPGNYSLTATVVGYGGSAAPTGTVSFLDTSLGNTSLGTMTLGSGTAGAGWLISQTPSTGTYPLSEVSGDFNQDGIPDVAVLWTSSSYGGPYSITILTGKGDGTFSAGTSISTGLVSQLNPYMICGDFNGDGKTDLAILSWNVGGSNTSYVTTLLSNGDGTFSAPQTNVAFNQGVVGGDGVPGSIVAADFNGDGKLDIAVVGDYVAPGGVTVLLGKGDGTFAGRSTFASKQDFGLIATGDFNGDGIPDLVVTNYFTFGGSPTIFLGKGDGTFTAKPTSFPLDYFPTSIVVGDFNGDGVLDLAFSDLNGVEIALGNGDGTFNETPASPIRVPSELYSLTVGDFNHDGKVDIAGLDNYNDRIVLLTGARDGTFAVTATTPAVSQDGLGPFALVAADFNGDGVPDLAMLTKNQAMASILITEPTETAIATLTGVAPLGAGTHNVEASYPGDSNYPPDVSSTIPLTTGLKPVMITPAGGTFSSVLTVTMTEAIPGATIYYMATGALQSNGFIQYTGPIAMSNQGRTTIQAYAVETGYQQSPYTTATFTLNLHPTATPVISLAQGAYSGTQTVTISDATPGATIYYTTNGSLPTLSSAQYTGPITVSSSQTLVATAQAYGYSMSPPASAQYIISSSSSSFIYTIAGSGNAGYSGDGGQATIADLNLPTSAVMDTAGNLYIAETNNNVVRRVAAGTGVITTVAGSGIAGYSGDGGAATKAQLSGPWSLALDTAGNLYIADSSNHVVRRVSAGTGVISTYAGNGNATYGGDNGPAINASLSFPEGIAFDGSGNLYIADIGSARVRKVAADTGIIITVAGTGSYGYSGDNGPATSANLAGPAGIAIDASGNLYLADVNNNRIRKVAAGTGIITTVAGNGTVGYSGDDGPAISAELDGPNGVTVDTAGNLYIADTYNMVIRKLAVANGTISTVAGNGNAQPCYSLGGDGGSTTSASLCYPMGISVDGAGNFYIADSSRNRVRLASAVGLAPTIAAAAPTFTVSPGTYNAPQTLSISDATPGAAIYITLDGTSPSTVSQGYHGSINVSGSVTINAIAVAPGYLPSSSLTASYTITSQPNAVIATIAGDGVRGFSGVAGAATSAEFGNLSGLVSDAAGNLYFSDTWNAVVWMLSVQTGNMSIIAGNGTAGYSGDGGAAPSAQINNPQGIAVDAAGNVYIADSGNNVIRKVVASTGLITTVAGHGGAGSPGNLGDGGAATAAHLSNPTSVALDTAGNLYIADTNDNSVRGVSASTGIITTIAGTGILGSSGDGGPATKATLYRPNALALDNAGNLYIATPDAGRIREVTASTGLINTVVGNGNRFGNSGDGGPAVNAEVYPQSLALDRAGNLYFSSFPYAVRKVDSDTGLITTVAGSGFQSFSGDGGSATIAELSNPQGIAFDAAGNLYIADSANERIRKIIFPPTIAATPTFSIASGTYSSAQVVAISDSIQGATIYYTIDGTTPTPNSTVYAGPITVSASETIKAIATATGYATSGIVTASYTINIPVAAAPTFSPAAGTYSSAQTVTITDATAGAAIYYTLDGSTPTASSSVYAGPITVSTTDTLKAIATASGYSTSAPTTATYTINIPANTVPILSSMSPAFIAVGSPVFALTITGSGFTAGSTVYWGGTALSTQVVSGTQLIAQVPVPNTGVAGISAITVQTPTPGGGISNPLQFEVDSASSGSVPPPSFSTLTATVVSGSTATYQVTLPSSATNVSVTCLNLPTGASCSYSASSGVLTITTSPTTPSGTYQITAVFTETLPGAVTGLVLLPILLSPIVFVRRKLTWRQTRCRVYLALLLLAAASGITACGGSGSTSTPPTTHLVTSSAVLTLTIR